MEENWNTQEKIIVDKALEESLKRVEKVIEQNNRKMAEREDTEKEEGITS